MIDKAYINFNSGYSLDEDKITTIHKFHQGQLPPYLISKLASEFGVTKVDSVPMPYNISGSIKKVGDGYEILVNGEQIYRRRRFTAAHELAHLLLHKDDIGDGIKDDALYRSTLSSYQEVEANKLAADILMPYNRIQEYLEGGKKMLELPSIFEVSDIAMCIRLGVSEFALYST